MGTSILGANLSGDGSVSNTYSASSTFDFAAKGDLLLGLISPLDGAPTDFQQIDFTVTLNGAEVVDETFTSLAAADAFFADDVINLGSVSGAAEITFAYDLVAGGSGGYGMDLAFGGAVPEPSTWAMMLIGFGGLGYAGLRRAGKGRSALNQRVDVTVIRRNPAPLADARRSARRDRVRPARRRRPAIRLRSSPDRRGARRTEPAPRADRARPRSAARRA